MLNVSTITLFNSLLLHENGRNILAVCKEGFTKNSREHKLTTSKILRSFIAILLKSSLLEYICICRGLAWMLPWKCVKPACSVWNFQIFQVTHTIWTWNFKLSSEMQYIFNSIHILIERQIQLNDLKYETSSFYLCYNCSKYSSTIQYQFQFYYTFRCKWIYSWLSKCRLNFLGPGQARPPPPRDLYDQAYLTYLETHLLPGISTPWRNQGPDITNQWQIDICENITFPEICWHVVKWSIWNLNKTMLKII